jgi:hypothetical protein
LTANGEVESLRLLDQEFRRKKGSAPDLTGEDSRRCSRFPAVSN